MTYVAQFLGRPWKGSTQPVPSRCIQGACDGQQPRHIRERDQAKTLDSNDLHDCGRSGGGELLDQQANRELDEIIYPTLGGDRENMNVAVQMDFRNQPDVWRRLVGKGTWYNLRAPRPIHRRFTASSIGSRLPVRPTDTS